MFAGSCLGVIFLVLSLEFLRRLGKEYDRYLAHQHKKSLQEVASQDHDSDASEEPLNCCVDGRDPKHSQQDQVRVLRENHGGWSPLAGSRTSSRAFRPNVRQQLMRALLHMLQFGVAYFIMLLAMYYNGYILICILIGAFLGAFIFSWNAIGTE